jgi:hypothetical protein
MGSLYFGRIGRPNLGTVARIELVDATRRDAPVSKIDLSGYTITDPYSCDNGALLDLGGELADRLGQISTAKRRSG